MTCYKLCIILSHILLTNYGEILVYVLCQVSIHYLPVKDVLEQFRHLLTQELHHIFFFCSFIFRFRQISKTPTICSLIFGFPTFSSIAAATDKKCRSAENKLILANKTLCIPDRRYVFLQRGGRNKTDLYQTLV